ncbi:hypothetical protein sscle_05g048150 [Sclerotinia sclerotiorum 1980 UF-70]|uniref:Peptidase S8/S53 domain-containing protein n=1 Tax=Sclerotinia sclerotiorum (strain ATCC 18683 / 1980 / Ss-1) TaxID=665079 RepID=A0A1D9Q534_SCLS1|nr:hypothetical protein sscle_05g048150 [Sclerotinia sclerotiorum 1980 UF-70]
MAQGDSTNDAQVPLAFAAAEASGFSLFFSFDYAGNGAWPQSTVLSFLNKYISSSAYYYVGDKPFVSTFEGPAALSAGGGAEINGLFSWAAWPWGNTDMGPYVDASYAQYLDDEFGGSGSDFSHYMMAISPWFFTNLPGYDKNWLWRGDSLWYDRWIQANYLQPEYAARWLASTSTLSHRYLQKQYFHNYPGNSRGMVSTEPGCRKLLRNWRHIWKHPQSIPGRVPTGTLFKDNIFYSALLSGPGATVTVTIGGNTVLGGWAKTPFDGVGIYHGNVSMNGYTGAVTITLSRGDAVITGKDISTTCTHDIQNWNAWVGYAYGETVTATPTSLSKQVCIAGTGAGNFLGLCQFTCSYGYCPVGSCVCTQMSTQRTLPKSLDVNGYPAAGLSASYEGVCAFACNYGYCPATTCGTTKEPESIPTISPFLPEACTAGSGSGNLGGLCGFACGYGFCPIIACSCDSKGALGTLPAYTCDDSGVPVAGLDEAVYSDLCRFVYQYGYDPPPTDVCISSTSSSGGSTTACVGGTGPDNVIGLCDFSCEDDSYDVLCDFACTHNYCPPTACSRSPPAGDGGVIYLPPSVWDPSSDPFGCNGNSICTLIIPPSSLPGPETINWPSLTTTLLASSAGSVYTKTTVLSVEPFTITETNFWSVTITAGDANHATFIPEQSFMPPAFILNLPGSELTFPPSAYPSYSNPLPLPTTTSATPIPTFFSTSHGVTILPMPTITHLLPHNLPVPLVAEATSVSFSDAVELVESLAVVEAVVYLVVEVVADFLDAAEVAIHRVAACRCPGSGTGDGDGDPDPTSASSCEPSTCATKTSCEAPKETVGCNIDPETGEEGDGFSHLYIVYPLDGTTSTGTDPIISLLKSYGTQSVTGLTTQASTIIGIMFWSLHLTPDQLTEVTNHELVASCTPQCTTSCPKIYERVLQRTPRNVTLQDDFSRLNSRELGLIRQDDALTGLVMISQEEGHDLDDYDGNYIYDKEEMPQTLVYVIDSYINTTDSQFDKFRSQITDMSPGEPPEPSDEDEDPMAHGTYVLSLIASKRFRVSKNISPVLIGLDNVDAQHTEVSQETFLIALNVAVQHYRLLGGSAEAGMAIVNLSLNFRETQVTDAWIDDVRNLLREFVNLGVLPVVSSGNEGLDSVRKYPVMFAASDIPEMLVVGAVDLDGSKTEYSNIDTFVSVHVFGATFCPNGLGGTQYQYGTSFSAPLVSGLAAYFLGLSSLREKFEAESKPALKVAALKAYIVKLAWSRDKSAIETIYNGVEWSEVDLTCPADANGQDGTDTCATSTTSTSTTTSTTTASTSAATNTFKVYEWECEGKQQITKLGAAAASALTYCASQSSFLSNEGGITQGDTFTVCGSKYTVATTGVGFAISGGGKTGTCSSVGPPDFANGKSCLGQSGDIISLACQVTVAYKCDIAAC